LVKQEEGVTSDQSVGGGLRRGEGEVGAKVRSRRTEGKMEIRMKLGESYMAKIADQDTGV